MGLEKQIKIEQNEWNILDAQDQKNINLINDFLLSHKTEKLEENRSTIENTWDKAILDARKKLNDKFKENIRFIDEQENTNPQWEKQPKISMEEYNKYFENFWYSAEKYKNKEDYVNFLAKELITIDKMNEFLKYMFEYNLQEDSQTSIYEQKFLNTASSLKQKWDDPINFVTDYIDKDWQKKFNGECIDIALFFQYLTQLQWKNSFVITMTDPLHAIAWWFEEVDWKLIAYKAETEDITWTWNASVVKLEWNEWETKEHLFKRLFEKPKWEWLEPTIFYEDIKTIDKSVNLWIKLSDGTAVDLPWNFELLDEYGRIKELFEKKEYNGIVDIIDSYLKRFPKNPNLLMAKSQVMILAWKETSYIKEILEELIDSIKSIDNKNSNATNLADINQFCYQLVDKQYITEACWLMNVLLSRSTELKKSLRNERDTYSDLLLSNQSYEELYNNELILIDFFIKMQTSKKVLMENFKDKIFMNIQNRPNIIRNRLERYENYLDDIKLWIINEKINELEKINNKLK